MARYTVTAIKGEFDAQFGKKRVNLTLENEQGASKDVSGFFKFPPKVGEVLEGEVVQKGQYWNFNFPSKTGGAAPSGDLLRIERKIDAVLTEIQMLRGVKTEPAKNPLADEFDPDYIDPAGIPF